MSRRFVLVVAAMVTAGIATARWLQVGAPAPTAQVRITEQSNVGVTFEVTVPGIEVTDVQRDGRGFSRVTFPGRDAAPLDVGRPEVPVIPVLLAVPNGARVSIHLAATETHEFQVAPVLPLQPPVIMGRQPADFVFDQAFYAQDESYPATEAAVKVSGGWHDLGVASVHVYPVQVNPGRGTIEVASRIVVRAEFTGGAYPQSVTGWMIPMYSRLVANWPDLHLPAGRDDANATKLLVICDNLGLFSTALDSLLAWTNSRGFKVQVETIMDGQKDPGYIKGKITDAYSSSGQGLRWVLLVGEYGTGYGQLPMESVPSPYPADLYPRRYGDFWYTDLDDTVLDYFPEVGICRLSVTGYEDLSNQVRKILAYQTTPGRPYDWLSTAQLVAHGQRPDSDFVYYMLRVQDPDTTQLAFFDFHRPFIDGGYQDNSALAESINAGVGLLMYFGHGSTTSWANWHYQQDWDVGNIRDLRNGAKTPVVWQFACNCSDLRTPECISEAWMRKDNGGAAACFGFFQSPYYTAPFRPDAAAPLRDFLFALGDTAHSQSGGGNSYPDPVFDLGDLWMYVTARCANLGEDFRRASELSLVCLGDPSMPVWSGGAPVSPQVNYPRTTPPSESVPVAVSVGGAPVENALVCLFKGSGLYLTARTNALGVCTLAVHDTTPGEIQVTVSEGHTNESQPGVAHTPILPFTNGSWCERAQVPLAPSGKKVKEGGWLAYNAGNGLVYAAKGNKQRDFYCYYPEKDSWSAPYEPDRLEPIPLGIEGKPPAKGCVGCADGSGHVYMTKGNNKLGFYKYDATTDVWSQKKDVPLGISNKKVKGGTGIAWAYKGPTGSPYLLKGYKNEFYRYDVAGDSWQTLTPAPVGGNQTWDKGSWLAVDEANNKIYALKAKYNEFYRYSPDVDSWSGALAGMPLVGQSGRSKKAKDGSRGAYSGGCIYALKGGNTLEFWRYDVPSGTWREDDTIPLIGSTGKRKRVKAGGSLTSDGSTLFALKGNKCNEFWRCTPGISTDSVLPGAMAAGIGTAPGGGRDAGETPVMDGIEASTPRWDPEPSSNMVVYGHEDTLGDGYEQVYQCFYGSSIPEQRVTEVATDCEEPVVSPLREGGQFIAFQIADTLSDCYQIAVTPAYAADGDGSDGTGEDVARKRGQSLGARGRAVQSPFSPSCAAPGTGDATAPASSVAPVGSVSALAATGGSTMLSRPIRQLTFGDEADRLHPEFDQTGSWLCYERDVDGPGGCYTQIWRVPADSGPEEQITFDNADHFSPTYLNTSEILFLLSPNEGYDVVAKVNVFTHQVTVLSNLQTDHDRPNPAGTYAVSEALDDAGNTQIVRIPVWVGPESWLTSGTSDIMEPDCNQDNQSVFAVRWTGITSQIVAVDAQNGGYWPVTDTLAIRDNPDGHPNPNGPTSLAVYEREAWNPLDLLLGGGRRKPGSGIYLSKFRKPHDGAQGTSLGIFALERATPNPATARVQIRYQIPAEAVVSLRVYNTAGQLVKVLAEGKTKPGAYTSVWNGTDTRGRRLAAGIYFCTPDNGEKRISRKVVLTE